MAAETVASADLMRAMGLPEVFTSTFSVQQRREAEGGTPAPRESVHYPPPPRGLIALGGGPPSSRGAGPPSSRASRGAGAPAAALRATPATGVTNVPSWLLQQ